MKRILFGVIALVIVGLGFFAYRWYNQWYDENYEKVTKDVFVGYHGEARTNSLLAAQRFFEAYHIPVSSHEGIAQIPPLDTTLIMPTQRLQMGENEAHRYLQWIEQGGHMVISATTFYSVRGERPDPLLDAVGITLTENDFTRNDPDETDDDDEDAAAQTKEKNRPNFQHSNMVYVDWPERNDLLTVQMDDEYRLDLQHVKAKVILALEDEIGVYLVRLQLGQGVLTVIYNSHFMRNNTIDRFDHATFLWWIAQLRDPPHALWLVYSDDMPSLLKWLWQNARTVMISFLVFLCIWLWYASQRFGPLLLSPNIARRSLLEHVEATGRYFWANQHGQRLYSGVQQNLLKTIERRHPAWLSQPPAKLHQHLAEVSRLSVTQIQQAMTYVDNRNEHEFTKAIQTLETIRKSL